MYKHYLTAKKNGYISKSQTKLKLQKVLKDLNIPSNVCYELENILQNLYHHGINNKVVCIIFFK